MYAIEKQQGHIIFSFGKKTLKHQYNSMSMLQLADPLK